MWPKRVGGIAATCAEAFRPYSPVLANLTGVCYWWGWVPTCGLTAILSASALHEWYLPGIPVTPLASAIVVVFSAVNLRGVSAATRLAVPIAGVAAAARAALRARPGALRHGRLGSADVLPPRRARSTASSATITSAMAGLYLIGFAAPAFEAATCHVGETKRPEAQRAARHVRQRRDGALYFVALPVVWLGALGAGPMGGELMTSARPDVRAAAGRRRQGGRDLVHGRSTCSTARCSRSPARRARSRSSPTTGCCRGRSACAPRATRRGSRRC